MFNQNEISIDDGDAKRKKEKRREKHILQHQL